MARDLHKFVNPRFLKTIDLPLLQRLMERQPVAGPGSWADWFAGEAPNVRERLKELFSGPESEMPQGLVADLHRIAELGTDHGMSVLQGRAERSGIEIRPTVTEGETQPLMDPKHFALIAFLDYPEVFNAAADFLELETRSSLAEYVGQDENVPAILDDGGQDRFEAAASGLFEADLRGDYCRVGCYEDGDDLRIVVTHGAPITVKPVIEDQAENIISYRAADHAVLSYDAVAGRLKVGGVIAAKRFALAKIFATTLLDRPDFFAGPEAQLLYTLAPVERRGFQFTVDHAFNPNIRDVQITEVQVDRVATDRHTGEVSVLHSILVRGRRGSALSALRELVPAGLAFGPDSYGIGHLTMRVRFQVAGRRAASVTVKVKPHAQAVFRRHRFEHQIMELLRRNGFCHERDASGLAAAAE